MRRTDRLALSRAHVAARGGIDDRRSCDKRPITLSPHELGAAGPVRRTAPALIIWAPENKVMPPEHGRRLAELIPRAEHVEVLDAYVLVTLDQPARVAALIGAFRQRTR